MNFMEHNLRKLAEKLNASGIDPFASVPPPDDFMVCETPSGYPTARYNGVYLHSRHDPRKEAERLVKIEAAGRDIRTIVVYGFGLGYLPEALLEEIGDADIYIVEPDLRLFKAALGVRDLSGLLASPRVKFFLALEFGNAALILEGREDDDYLIVRLRSVYEKDREYYEKIDTTLSGLLRRKEINRNTLARFGRLWVRNLVRNLEMSETARGIRELEGLLAGIPAVVVAAGPTLDEVLPVLGNLRERCLIVAVDTSLRACLRAGVDPDFTVVVDPQYWNTRHLDWTGDTESILVSESSTHPRIFRKRFADVFFCGSLFPMGEYIEERTGRRGRLGAGGSVSTSAWDFARILGCSPIFMAGLDLGFPARRTHFTGSFFEHRIHTSSRRLLPLETSSFLALRDAGPFRVNSNDGTTCLTDNRLIVYKAWFETQMNLHPECRTFNLSSGGVLMEGMPYRELGEVLELPEVRGKIDGVMNRILRDDRTTSGNYARIREAVGSLTAELIELDALAKMGMETSTCLRAAFESGKSVDGIVRELSGIDARITTFPAKETAGFLLSSIRQKPRRPESGCEGQAIIEQSLTLYTELHESIAFHLKLLETVR